MEVIISGQGNMLCTDMRLFSVSSTTVYVQVRHVVFGIVYYIQLDRPVRDV